MRVDLLGLGRECLAMLEAAEKVSLSMPPAFKSARKKVRKDFYVLRKRKEVDKKISISIADLSLLDDFHVIEKNIGWASKIAEQESLFHFLMGFSPDVQKLCNSLTIPESMTQMLQSQLSINRFIKHEILAYASSKKGGRLGLEGLKSLIVANILFDADNEDVLKALRIARKRRKGEMLYQNGCAELLFSRIPLFLNRITIIDVKTIRQKLFKKLQKLDLPVKHISVLMGYFQSDIKREDLLPALDKFVTISKKLAPSDTSEKIRHYISSIKNKLKFSRKLYNEMFLPAGLTETQKLYTPVNILQTNVSYRRSMISDHTHVATLEFYPTKDYMDLWRGNISGDCVKLLLAKKQLSTPNFFNIRVFQDSSWIGNIYMLDFTEKSGILLVDRIQIQRDIRADYIDFFDHLKEIFQEMFVDVEYKKILLPSSISNHGSIQNVFNKYNDKLVSEETYMLSELAQYLPSSMAEHFESLRQRAAYYVL